MSTITISESVQMPTIGLGTWQLKDPDKVFEMVEVALGIGYRLFDSGSVYGNEAAIGVALKSLLPKYGLSRSDVFLTSKLPPKAQGDGAQEACATSLRNLGMDYVDLYLIHWPGSAGLRPADSAHADRRRRSWRALEEAQRSGKARAIGVSNYGVGHLEELLGYAEIRPAVNQCEFHPHFLNTDLREFCRREKIHFQAYASLGSHVSDGKLLREPLVQEMATAKKATPAQVLLAFGLAHGHSILPRSRNRDHVISNFESSKVVLSENDILRLSSLEGSNAQKYCWNSDKVL